MAAIASGVITLSLFENIDAHEDYAHLCRGLMTVIRNMQAHANIPIIKKDSEWQIMLMLHLFYMVQEKTAFCGTDEQKTT